MGRLAMWIGALVGAALLVLAGMSLSSPRPVETFAFFVFGGAMAVAALAIVLERELIRCACWLLGVLCPAAGLYLLLGAYFLAAVQLIVYAGGILVLIVFGVMLTAGAARNLPAPGVPERAGISLAAGGLLAGLATVLLAQPWPTAWSLEFETAPPAVRQIGAALLTTYLVPFEAASVLLLAAMVGAAYLARPMER